MKHIIKSQFVLCFLTETRVVTDASLASFGVDTETVETFTLEIKPLHKLLTEDHGCKKILNLLPESESFDIWFKIIYPNQ